MILFDPGEDIPRLKVRISLSRADNVPKRKKNAEAED